MTLSSIRCQSFRRFQERCRALPIVDPNRKGESNGTERQKDRNPCYSWFRTGGTRSATGPAEEGRRNRRNYFIGRWRDKRLEQKGLGPPSQGRQDARPGFRKGL